MNDYDMDPEDRAKLLNKTQLSHEDYPLYHEVREKLAAVRGLAWELHDKMTDALWDITQQYRKTLAGIAEHKKEYDAILHEYSTVPDMATRAHDLSWIVKWPEIFGHPHMTISDKKGGWRVDVQPEETNRLYYSDWIERIATGRTFWGVNGLPNDPAGIYPHPQPSGSTESQEQEQDGGQQQEQEQKERQEQQEQQEQPGSAEAGPSRPPPQPVAIPEEVASSLSGSFSVLNAASSARLPGQPSSPEHTRSPTPGPSDTNTRPTKLDKGKGKAVDTPHKNIITTTAAIFGSSSTSAADQVAAFASAGPSNTNNTRPTKLDKGNGKAVDTPSSNTGSSSTAVGPSTSAAVPVSASASAVAGPSNPGNDTIVDTTKTTNNSNNSTITAIATKEESNQEVIANNAKDKSTARATKIKIVIPANKRDLKGKGKAVDKPSNTKKNNHKIIKPSGSEQPAAVAKRETIKRSQVYKEKYWVFKLDSSMFTDKGRIKKEFLSGKGKATVSANANYNDDNDGEDNGEGSSKSTATTPITDDNDDNSDNDHNEGDNTSDDELALDANSDNSDNFDSGSETDDSKDSNFTLTLKSKKRKAAATAVNPSPTKRSTTTATTTTTTTTVTTVASASSSGSNKRKRTTADTGEEPETGDEPEDPNAYYVLRCPFGELCTTNTPDTHNAPANIKGVFTRHPFKKRRAWEHFSQCKLRKTYKSEEEIWKNCCLKVVPERKDRPVDDAWAKRHNRTLIRSLVKQAGGGKKEKAEMEKEMEEEL